MNEQRRKELNAIYTLIEEARDRLECVKDEEEEYKDNIPENLQGSERYERAEEVVGVLESSLDAINLVLDDIEEAAE